MSTALRLFAKHIDDPPLRVLELVYCSRCTDSSAMGHLTVLVIGDDFRDQLSKYQRAETAPADSRHFVEINLLDGKRRPHWPAPGSASQDWLRAARSMSFPVLQAGQTPDRHGVHKEGWVRVDQDGVIQELIERTIPGGFHDWFEGTWDDLPLKPGASGESVDARCVEESVCQTSAKAGRARKRDIDFATLLEPIRTEAASWWDRARQATSGLSWHTLAELQHDSSIGSATESGPGMLFEKWLSQPAVQEIGHALSGATPSYTKLKRNWNTPGTSGSERAAADLVDAFRLERTEYQKVFGPSWVLITTYCIADGVLHDTSSRRTSWDALIEAAPDDAWLTLAQVHA